MANTKALNGLRGGMRNIVSTATLIAVLAWHLCQAEGTRDSTPAADARAGQDAPIRRSGAVEAVGRWVVDHYDDKSSAQYGILDVTQAPYSADRTGKRDATRAIQQAMKDARDARLITFLPGGTYRVSDTMTCIQGVVMRDQGLAARDQREGGSFHPSFYFPCVLMGSRTGARSRIMLAPRSAGFGDPQKPKPVIHFWARSEFAEWGLNDIPLESTQPDPNEPEPAISYNQLIVDVDLSLGKGNPGAVGIDHQAAQGSAIEDVTVDATGAFAGIHKAPGSGGGIHGLTVIGGRYGLYLKGDPGVFWRGAQPVPVVSNVTLKGQTERAILYDGRGPLTVVGGRIEGAEVQAQGPLDAPWNGAMNFVDTVFRPRGAGCAITSNHSLYLHNVFFEHSDCIARVDGQPELKSSPERWTHIEEYAAGATLHYPQWLGGVVRQDAVYLDGHPALANEQVRQLDAAAPPPDLQSRHAWSPLPAWDSPGVANVRAARYGAKGDGKTDDAPALQRAIDENDTVFLPKGEYKLSRPLVLRSQTRLFGIGNVLAVLSPLRSAEFMDPQHPAPLIETVDDPKAHTLLAFVELLVPVTDPSVYALRWRAGGDSVVRNIRPAPAISRLDAAAPSLVPLVRIEGSGGGRWYDLQQDYIWSQGPDYRHLLVEGTREPLSFYMLDPEHTASDAQVEFHDARNVSVYSLKAEGMFTVLWMRGCRNVRIYGYGGVAAPRPNWSLFRIEKSDDFLLANLNPDQILNQPDSKSWDTGWMPSDPSRWFITTDTPRGSQTQVGLHGTEQIVLYKRGNPQTAQ